MTPTPPDSLDHFDALLQAARQQDEPQRLLMVFAQSNMDEHANAEQRQSFERGEGGYLEPRLVVDKDPDEVRDFAALREESKTTGVAWDLVFVSTMSGRAGIPPSPDEARQPLRFMLTAINEGRVADLAAFDRDGTALRFLDTTAQPR